MMRVMLRAVYLSHALLLIAALSQVASAQTEDTAVFRVLSRPSVYKAEELTGILEKQLAILDELLAAGANLEASDQAGRTLLLEAARMNYDDGSPALLLKALIERGADVWARDGEGHTAIMLAVLNTHPKVNVETLPLLLAAGCDVNARDKAGKTAMDYARQRADTYGEQEWRASLGLLASAGATTEASEPGGAMKSPK
jgi:Ankyrin repeats (3 copies)